MQKYIRDNACVAFGNTETTLSYLLPDRVRTSNLEAVRAEIQDIKSKMITANNEERVILAKEGLTLNNQILGLWDAKEK